MSRIGAMRTRLAVQAESRVPDGGGGASLGWTTIATIWAEVIPLMVRENLQAEGLAGQVTHKIVTRYDSGITAAHRLLLGSRSFNIRGIRHVGERGRLLEILAEEGVAT